ncbi:hypothetical protein [Roseibium marinum]|uniref:Uncharacterized protein n=1 Tax=Roseibium marinum TaxID=281252 RepID=A0A2S3V1C4_9HYPH|nr:hypothetical protein [Roseibium marinum]POF33772.1 hypothetical protein CLV41_101221 [Roseibium marinum]
MAYTYLGVPPRSGQSAAIETGVYLRMGTYVDDASVNEAGEFPGHFYTAPDTNDAAVMATAENAALSTSEGIFITTVGTYVVQARDAATVEIQNGVNQDLTGDAGTWSTTVESGDIAIDIRNGAFNVTGKTSYLIESDTSDVKFTASNGKISTSGNYIYNHTYGSYIKWVDANSTSGVQGTKTNVSIALVMSFYGALVLSAKVSSLSMKVESASATGVKIGGGGISLGMTWYAHDIVANDIKVAWMYIKYRGVQLESTAAQTDTTGLMSIDGHTVSLNKAAAIANTSTLKGAFGITSTLPGS